MRAFLPVMMLILIGSLPAVGQAPAAWRPLFDGKDLDGWSVADAQGKPAFTVEDGSIRTQPGSGTLWYSREKIGNATLRVIYRMANSAGSSGILIRIPEPASLNQGLDVRIDDRGDDRHVTGVLDSLTNALARAIKMEGEWNTMDITMHGPRTAVKLNGAMVTDDDGSRRPAPESGYVAIRHPDGRAVIWFREISVR